MLMDNPEEHELYPLLQSEDNSQIATQISILCCFIRKLGQK